MFRQVAAVLLLLLMIVIVPACGGNSGGTTAESQARSSPPGTATLSWTPVTTDTSGAALTNLAGYKIHYGTSAQAMYTVDVLENPSKTTYVVQGLSSGTWYFAVSAYTTSDTEGALSNVASKTINQPP
jgi:hypothetical protein